MNKHVRAKIYWLPPEAGGRKMPPSGPKYSTVSRFEDEKDTTPQSVWSLVVELGDLQTESREMMAAIWFLSEDKPDAPLHLLHAGSRFELLEGQRVVARGEVLG